MKQRGTIYDTLRVEAMRNGAWKSPHPLGPRLEAVVQRLNGDGVLGTMDQSGIGQGWTTSRSSRTYAGGGLTPMAFWPTPAGPNSEIALQNAPVAVNARAAYPGRGMEPLSPLMRRN
jgi:hypothetical protein